MTKLNTPRISACRAQEVCAAEKSIKDNSISDVTNTGYKRREIRFFTALDVEFVR